MEQTEALAPGGAGLWGLGPVWPEGPSTAAGRKRAGLSSLSLTHLPASLSRFPSHAWRRAWLADLHPPSERVALPLPIIKVPWQARKSGVLAFD